MRSRVRPGRSSRSHLRFGQWIPLDYQLTVRFGDLKHLVGKVAGLAQLVERHCKQRDLSTPAQDAGSVQANQPRAMKSRMASHQR